MNIVGRRTGKGVASAGGTEPLGTGTSSSVHLADNERRHRTLVTDHPSRLDDRRGVGRASKHTLSADHLPDAIRAIDAVQHANDDGIRAQNRQNR